MRALKSFLLFILVPSWALSQSVDEGVALFNKGKMAEAKGVLETVLKQDEKNAEAHYRLGLILLSRQFRNENDAVDQMEEAVDINPNKAKYQYGLGAAYASKAQNAGIIKQAFLAPKVKKAFEKAVELNPMLIEAHIGLAQYYWRAPGIMGGDMEKAWKEADVVIGLDEIRGRPFKAAIYVAEKKTDEAVKEIKTLTSNKAAEWRAWRAAGSFYLQNQMTDEAIAAFEKYVTMRPDTAHSHYTLAAAFVQKKDADRALACAGRSLAIDNDYAPGINVLAQAYELKGQKNEAREQYQRLLAMDLPQEQKKNIEKKINELQ